MSSPASGDIKLPAHQPSQNYNQGFGNGHVQRGRGGVTPNGRGIHNNFNGSRGPGAQREGIPGGLDKNSLGNGRGGTSHRGSSSAPGMSRGRGRK